jgi:hypothetical protein
MLNIHRLSRSELFSLHNSSGIRGTSFAITSVTAYMEEYSDMWFILKHVAAIHLRNFRTTHIQQMKIMQFKFHVLQTKHYTQLHSHKLAHPTLCSSIPNLKRMELYIPKRRRSKSKLRYWTIIQSPMDIHVCLWIKVHHVFWNIKLLPMYKCLV